MFTGLSFVKLDITIVHRQCPLCNSHIVALLPSMMVTPNEIASLTEVEVLCPVCQSLHGGSFTPFVFWREIEDLISATLKS